MRPYHSFEEKIQTYIDAIVPPALAAHPDATPLRGISIKAAKHESPLRLPDTLSSRYHMNDLSARLLGKRVAIIGLGGTGSYILDFIARTHLAEIVLFDDDKLHIHTFFRFPGFMKPVTGKKVDVLARVYDGWHGAISAKPERITQENIESLAGFDFVFVSVDHGPSRVLIVDWLTSHDVPFVDCGMGLNRGVGGLSGIVRITGTDRDAYTQTAGSVHLPAGDPVGGEYRRQGQIAEMNALNAALAVIRFKQHFGIYEHLDDGISYLFDSATYEMDSKKRTS
ncbi:ThiF family adenylyltransferase [Brevundimonas sp. 2R-24]|uniref:ThiF family adenylyltransferase n=2 Tax=Peiella sedimenti TaxID=3061083 RepID=A0ABT8SP20_9CAUL|nr:ThiF family adenylyltransferase [Caulobacteraceae bacterium XZ-24]